MKKILVRIIVVLAVLVILGVLAVSFFLDSAIKKGVETYGPQLTKVSIKLDSVSLSILSGSGKVKGLVVGNPEGYKTPTAISVGSTAVSVSPGSLMSDKIVVRSIRIESPQITYELGPGGNNLKVIQANVEAATGGASKEAPKEKTAKQPAKKLQVDEVVITGGQITLGVTALGGKVSTVPLPDIHLKDLGQGPEGITAGDLTKRILDEITAGSMHVATKALADLGKGATDAAKSAAKTAGETVEKATKGITDLFKKK